MAGFQIPGLGQAHLAGTATSSPCPEATAASPPGEQQNGAAHGARQREEGKEEEEEEEEKEEEDRDLPAALAPAGTAPSREELSAGQTGEIGVTGAAAGTTRPFTIIEPSPGLPPTQALESTTGEIEMTGADAGTRPSLTCTLENTTDDIGVTGAAAGTSPSLTYALGDATGEVQVTGAVAGTARRLAAVDQSPSIAPTHALENITGEVEMTGAVTGTARPLAAVEQSPSIAPTHALENITSEVEMTGAVAGASPSPIYALDHATGEIEITGAAAGTARPLIALERSPSPSLTHALEDAIGGLEDATAVSQAQKPPSAEAQADALPSVRDEAPEWEVDSSPYQSSADSSTSDSSDAGSDDDDDDGDDDAASLLGAEETARLLMEMEGGSDDGAGKVDRMGSNAQLRTKNEVAEEAVVRPDVTITPEMEIRELGYVEHVVENVILIKAITPGEYQVLDTGSVICDAGRVVLGAIAETIGKVVQPMYTVRFNSADEIKALGVGLASKLYYAADLANYVFTQPLKNLKGSDASNIHDEEVGADEVEFSDDEKEAAHKRSLKQQKSRSRQKTAAEGARGGDRTRHPLRREVKLADGAAGLDYDDGDDDGPYKPLARPPDYGAGAGTAASEPAEPYPASPAQRGPRRGADRRSRRGRGKGLGRGGGGGGHGYAYGNGYGSVGSRNEEPSPRAWDAPPLGYLPQQSRPAIGTGIPPVPFIPPALPPRLGFHLPPPGPLPQYAGQGSAASAFPLLPPPPPPPPPPPGWGPQAAGPSGGAGAYVDPAVIAALMNQLQGRGQGCAPQWPGQQQQRFP